MIYYCFYDHSIYYLLLVVMVQLIFHLDLYLQPFEAQMTLILCYYEHLINRINATFLLIISVFTVQLNSVFIFFYIDKQL